MSSSFRDNFERGSDEQSKLGYDDSAFHYFSFSLMISAALPCTWYMIIKPIIYGEKNIEPKGLKSCECDICDERLIKRKRIHAYTFLNKYYALKIVFCTILWAITLYYYEQVKDIITLQTFQPHEILGIDMTASVAEVKRAYRRLSREKHPDKNPDNPQAKNEFIQITKAYSVMTDPVSRDNFLKYGNPDGMDSSYSVGIALPKAMLEKDLQIFFLILFFLIIVIAIPYFFYHQITQKNKNDVGGISNQNRIIFESLIDEKLDLNRIIGILAQGVEFQSIKVRSKEELQALQQLRSIKVNRECIPSKGFKNKPPNIKPIILLNSFLHGIKIKDIKNFDEDLEQILRQLPTYITVMMELIFVLIKMRKKSIVAKKMTCKNLLSMVQFSQNLMQNGFVDKDPFMTLPYMTKEYAQALENNLPDGFTLYKYATMDKQSRLEIAQKVFVNQQKIIQQQEMCLEKMPIVKLQFHAYVAGCDNIQVGDILTCKLRVDFMNLKKGERSGYVHSPTYPYLRRDTWYLVITNEQFSGIASLDILDCSQEFFEKTFNERMSRSGPINFIAILTNDSYRGLDQYQRCSINVQDVKSDAQEYVKEDMDTVMMESPIKLEDFPADESDSDVEAPYNQEGKEDECEEDSAELIRRLIKLGKQAAADQILGLDNSDAESSEDDSEKAQDGEGGEEEHSEEQAEDGQEAGEDEVAEQGQREPSPEQLKKMQEELIKNRIKYMKKLQEKNEKAQATRRNNWTQHAKSEVVLAGQSKEEMQKIKKANASKQAHLNLFKGELHHNMIMGRKDGYGWSCVGLDSDEDTNDE